MSQGPDFSKHSSDEPEPSAEQPYGAAPPPPPYGAPQAGYGQPGQAPYGAPGHGPGMGVPAPYGVHPVTGLPYSDKSKLVAGLLQILIPLGIGRFYIGDSRTGVAQLLVTIFTCGVGSLWPFIDGIMMLVGDPLDAEGRPLRG